MDTRKTEHIKFRTKIECEYYKIFVKEALINGVKKEDLIEWIKETFNVKIDESNHKYINSMFEDVSILENAKKYHNVKKEIKKEAKEDPRFQMMAREIDELKEEIKVLKKLCSEK